MIMNGGILDAEWLGNIAVAEPAESTLSRQLLGNIEYPDSGVVGCSGCVHSLTYR